jgi:hypothetical protein
MKESLKELLERLDSQSAQYSAHLSQANTLFDNAVKKIESLLGKEKKELHQTITKLKKVIGKAQDNLKQQGKKKS